MLAPRMRIPRPELLEHGALCPVPNPLRATCEAIKRLT